MDAAPGSAEHELESLTQFLYLAPIGLIQASTDGAILLLNPMSAQLLMPLARDAELTNLFDALESLAPGLRAEVREFALPYGRVCDNVRLQVTAAADAADGPTTLSLTLLKLDETRLMAVLSDVSAAVRREAALRRSRSWITTILSGCGDYALMSLDRHGSVQGWNPGVGEVTGFTREDTVGRSCAIFCAEGGDGGRRVETQLAAARREGWHLEDGWCRRADGSRFWGSGLLVPLEPGADDREDAAAFSFVLRSAADSGDGPPAEDR